MHFEIVHSINTISPESWNSICKNQGPFLQRPFLLALEESGSVNEESGWQPCHLVGYQNNDLVAIVPMYKKTHSYGEYVFDFAWADAYQQHQLAYYPKLISAIPFTPVSGSRILTSTDIDTIQLLDELIVYLRTNIGQLGVSSFHFLFPEKADSDSLKMKGCPQRISVQFQWFNKNYADFEDFLNSFTARRRKSVKKERKKIAAQGVTISRLKGKMITAQDMDFFYQCYCQTYLKRSGHNGYLTEEFFKMLLTNMPESLLLVIASDSNGPVASALYLFDDKQLNGRYWGALKDIDSLHFECCYYQGIEFCIENKLKTFNPGTQGEHKILRGFEPTLCYSNHYLAEPAFHAAIERFIEQETPGIMAYKSNASRVLPFKQSQQ